MDISNLPFMDYEHKDFFENAMHETGTAYPPNIAGLYLLSANEETRSNFYAMVDLDGNFMDDLGLDFADPDTRRLVALAANLAGGGGGYPELSPAYLYTGPHAAVLKAATDYWFANA